MSNWRRRKPRNNNNNNNNNFNRHHQRATQSTKPPLDNPELSVPAWEKDFCAVIGCLPWRKVLEAKQFMYPYNVVQWEDSAGEDAFKNAKSRFWAKINGFPCDLSLPDPDMYIDDVDWDAEVDTELMLDLERSVSDTEEEEEEEHVVNLDALFLSDQYNVLCLGPTGWGDDVPVNPGLGEAQPNITGWGDAEWINTGWGDAEPNNTGWGPIIKETGGIGKPENSWDEQKHCDGSNGESWERKKKTESWNHMNKKKNFKTKSWDHKNGRYQGRDTRVWVKKGEAPLGGEDRVVDCRRRNERGRSRGGFQQQHSNGWGWTESF